MTPVDGTPPQRPSETTRAPAQWDIALAELTQSLFLTSCIRCVSLPGSYAGGDEFHRAQMGQHALVFQGWIACCLNDKVPESFKAKIMQEQINWLYRLAKDSTRIFTDYNKRWLIDWNKRNHLRLKFDFPLPENPPPSKTGASSTKSPNQHQGQGGIINWIRRRR